MQYLSMISWMTNAPNRETIVTFGNQMLFLLKTSDYSLKCSMILNYNVLTGRLHRSVWPDWAIYWSLGNFLKPLSTINLPKYHTFLGNFCKGVKIYHFSSEIHLGNFYRHLAMFFWSHWHRYTYVPRDIICKRGTLIWLTTVVRQITAR